MRQLRTISLFVIICLFVFVGFLCNNSTQVVYSGEYSDTILNIEYLHKHKKDTSIYVRPPYTLSDSGRKFIKKFEGLKLKAYWLKGESGPTIGYGHRLLRNEHFRHISLGKAEEIFSSDIDKCEKSAERLLSKLDKRFKFSQSFIDGLISLIYNCGEYGVSTTKFYKRLQKSRYDQKSNNINREDFLYATAAVTVAKISWKGHVDRRRQEYLLMIK